MKYMTAGELHMWWSATLKEDGFDDSLDCTFTINNETGDFDIASYHDCCRHFALAMGFAPATVDEWFGSY